MARHTPKDIWPVRAGEYEGYTAELPWDPDVQAVTDWRAQCRPGSVPATPVVELGIDETMLGEAIPAIRVFFEGPQLTEAMDGWMTDIAYLDSNGKPATLIEIELRVESEYTQ